MSSSRRTCKIKRLGIQSLKSNCSRIPIFHMTYKHKSLRRICFRRTTMQVGAIILIVAVSYKIPKLYEYFLSIRRPKDKTANIDANILSPKKMITSNIDPPFYAANTYTSQTTYITPTTQTDSESCLSINYWWTFFCEKFEDLFGGYENSIHNEGFVNNEYDVNNFNNFTNFGCFNYDSIFEEKAYQMETMDHPFTSKLNNEVVNDFRTSKLDNKSIKDYHISMLDNKTVKNSHISHISKLGNKTIRDSHVSKLISKNTKDPLVLKSDHNPLILKLDKSLSSEIQEINHNYRNHSRNGPSKSKSSNSSEQMDFGTLDRTNSLFINQFEYNANDSDKALKLRTLLKKREDSEFEVVKCLTKALVIQGNREVLVKSVIREVEVLRSRMDRDFGQ